MTTGDLLVARVVDEAARHAEPAGAADGRRQHQGGDGLVQGAHRRHRGPRRRCGRRDDGRARARRTRRCASSAATRSRSSSATTRGTSRPCRERAVVSARHLVLVGLMGAGKTTVGRRVRRAARPAVRRHRRARRSTDRDARSPRSSRPRASRRSAPVERVAVADACASPEPLVIACGGGAMLDPDNRRSLRATGFVVWLARRAGGARRRVGREPTRSARCSPARRHRQPRRSSGSRCCGPTRTRPPPTLVVDTDDQTRRRGRRRRCWHAFERAST